MIEVMAARMVVRLTESLPLRLVAVSITIPVSTRFRTPAGACWTAVVMARKHLLAPTAMPWTLDRAIRATQLRFLIRTGPGSSPRRAERWARTRAPAPAPAVIGRLVIARGEILHVHDRVPGPDDSPLGCSRDRLVLRVLAQPGGMT